MRALLIAAVTLVSTGCAGMAPVAEEDRTFSKVYEAPGASRDEIFTTTRQWLAETFESAEAVIEYENKDEGAIIGNGVIEYPCSGVECVSKADWRVPFTMRVDMKNERFRLSFSNINLAWPAEYNSVAGYQDAHNAPVQTQGDMDKIKPELLALGDRIANRIEDRGVNEDW